MTGGFAGAPFGAAGPDGHGANSQFGPVLATVLPSGQIFASFVHAFTGGPASADGQGSKAQLGGLRETKLPSGHSLTSCAHIFPSPAGPSAEPASTAGQGANSQLGPVRETALPSGQIFASWVQAFGGSSTTGAAGAFDGSDGPHARTRETFTSTATTAETFMAGEVTPDGRRDASKLGPKPPNFICKNA